MADNVSLVNRRSSYLSLAVVLLSAKLNNLKKMLFNLAVLTSRLVMAQSLTALLCAPLVTI